MVKSSKTVGGITLVKVGRHTFVSGLFWQILSSPRASVYMPEARRLAREEKARSGVAMDVVAVRENKESVQAGFVARGAGAKRGMYSLAATAADVIGGSFIAAFDLNDGRIAVVAAMDGAIVPDSDQVVTPDEARELVRVLWNDLSGTTKEGEQLAIIAPAAIFPGAEQAELSELVPGLRRSQRLRPLSRFSKRELVMGAAVLLGTVAGLYAFNAYQAHQAELERIAAEARARELERIRRQSGRDANEIALSHPWSATPAASVFVGHCTQALWSLPLTIDGWPLATASCSVNGGASAVYMRGKGRDVLAFRSKAGTWRNDLTLQFETDGAAVTVRFPVRMPAGGDDPLKPMGLRSEPFVGFVQRAQLDVPMTVTAAKSTFTAGYTPTPIQGEPPPQPDWQTLTWEIKDSTRSPSAFLEGIPDEGIRAKALSLGFAKGKIVWSISGEIYGK